MKNNFGLALLVGSVLMGCTATITAEMLPLATSLAPQSAAEQADFDQARQTFIDRCSGCHFHMYPSEYTPRQWKLTLREHKGSTNLGQQEYEKLSHYILRASELSHGK